MSRAEIVITERDGKLDVNVKFEPTLNMDTRPEEHPAAFVALQMLGQARAQPIEDEED